MYNSIQQTSDGGYILAGKTESFGSGGKDIFILKLDSTGNVRWAKTYGSPADDYASSIQQTIDGGYIIAGNIGNDIWVLKINAAGALGNYCPFGIRSFPITMLSDAIAANANLTTNNTSISISSWNPYVYDTTALPDTQCTDLPPGEAKNLIVNKIGGKPVLSWDAPSGACFHTSYAVYRGNLPISSYNHISLDCNVPNTTYTDYNVGGSYYYLVVPNRNAEGSYGKSFNGTIWSEIPQSSSPCYPQNINPC